MSGQATLIGPPNNVEFDRVAGVLGCQNQVDRQKELECMKAVDAPRLRRAVNNATRSELAGGFSGGLPGHDNVTSFSPEILRERAQEGRFAKIVCPRLSFLSKLNVSFSRGNLSNMLSPSLLAMWRMKEIFLFHGLQGASITHSPTF